jgi:hypothetical protein
MTKFTGRHIAYAAVQVFRLLSLIYCLLTPLADNKAIFLLGTSETWSADDEGFNLSEFFNLVVELFEEYPSSEWVVSTLAWFDG